MQRLVIASSNAGKIAEFRALFAARAIEIVPQAELGIADADEPHFSFVENALAKARHASRASGLAAMADDSGICVAALGGEPGVHSARFAVPGASEAPAATRAEQDARNNAKLVRLLARASDRRAHYYCVIVLVRRHDDPEPLIAEGRWHGEVLEEPRGAGGFGYDPYFLLPQFGRTVAELDAQEKNRVSHRGRACARLLALIDEAT